MNLKTYLEMQDRAVLVALALWLIITPSWPIAVGLVAVVALVGGLSLISKHGAQEMDALRAQVEEAKKDAARALSAAAAAKGTRGF